MKTRPRYTTTTRRDAPSTDQPRPYACSTFHDDERIICYRAPPGVSLTFGPTAFPPGFRVVLDVDTAPLPLAVAVWDYETLTDLDATAVPLGYV